MNVGEEIFASMLFLGGMVAVIVGSGLWIAGMHDVATTIMSVGGFVAVVGFLAFALEER